MSRFFVISRASLGLAWLLFCLLAWWSGRSEIFSSHSAKASVFQTGDLASEAVSAKTLADQAFASAAKEETIAAALEEIHRLSKEKQWGSSSDLLGQIRQGKKFRYAQSLPVPVLRGVLKRLIDDPSDENGSLAFQLAQNVLLERDPRSAYDIMMAVIGL